MNSVNRNAPLRIAGGQDTLVPQVQLLSNGSYHVMLTSAGGGYSRWKNLAVTRWREDATCDNWGAFCYIGDVTNGDVWSTTHQPTLRRADTYEVAFAPGHAVFDRSDHAVRTQTEIAVAPEDDVELRRVRVTNGSSIRTVLEITSYAEIVLAPPAADAAHPAFSKLFVESEILRERQAILCTRRPRAPDEPTPWMFHLLTAPEPARGEVSYETDRMRFIGRGRSTADPQALDDDMALSGSAGAVLDAVVAIRCRIALYPGQAASVDLITGIGPTREKCLGLVAKYQHRQMADRVLAAAPAQGQAVLSRLHASETDARLYARLAGSVIYANASLRAPPSILGQNREGQSALWGYAISGDLPIVLLRISDPANIDLARQLAQAHAYWRLHGLAVDLVILCEGEASDQPALHEQITKLIAAGGDAGRIDQPGGFFVRPADKMPEGDCVLLRTVARVVISDADGPLAQQLERRCATPISSPPSATARRGARATRAPTKLPDEPAERDLLFYNGMGGFTPDGREYVITTRPGQMTPAPWVNVLANPSFGTLVSESGSATTWSENAHEFRRTPWSNDPVGDANTEAYYIRDEASGHYWSPTLLPRGGAAPYVTRHGFGYSVFEHDENSIDSELVVYVAKDEPVKFAVLTLRNRSGRARWLSVTGYLEWVLGDEATKTRLHVSTEADVGSGALFARNPYNTQFAGRAAFFVADDVAGWSFCGDRAEFLGRNGTLRDPAAMSQVQLSGTVGAALDPCAAIRIPFELADGQTREIAFRLGAGASIEEARRLVQRWQGSSAAHEALAAVKKHWQHTLGAVQVETPNRSLDILTNGWLVYQILACRMWARTAFYQSSGAFGFRDQLQDAMALVHATPELVREHLLHCASRQFPEGDVQHWWHPPSGSGVRTRCSDDYLWLPLATCRYVGATGDALVLDEPVHFLDGRALKDEEESAYDLPRRSDQVASLYDHCVRAVEHGLRCGTHGLPLMGSGDWNEGMNLVGAGGKGESVWLGFFLYAVLAQFGELARGRGDAPFAERCGGESIRLRDAIEQHAWDGAWYRRAWFDDGSPLGTAESAECRIDSIAQSWAVLSGAGNAQRAREAMNAVDTQLVRRDAALIRLLDPPFDHSEPSPGYIQGYVRGVRENGGQYTHAAVWAAMAFAALGDAKRAWELFSLLDPVNHTNSPDSIAVYKTEPYVLAGDVYALAPHTGRGGWAWYTGSAGWMYRFILESLLGLRLDADKLHVSPCLPADWNSFQVHYRYRQTIYHITVLQTSAANGEPRLTVDGVLLPGQAIPLVDDRREHLVEVRIPPAQG
ncbi:MULTISPECIES: glycosyl hydrolase family 65 protein [unclassified Variovorax]|uniref:GH36-type glycosyl hydrolase domain-containing protein n=1 Tax=unclassified Variovorax TaxID=663243 RepID=UPI001E5AB1B9|nr:MULTISPECIES: glycosyl hydrolase family 65 protein [unclassified Variovorax]